MRFQYVFDGLRIWFDNLLGRVVLCLLDKIDYSWTRLSTEEHVILLEIRERQPNPDWPDWVKDLHNQSIALANELLCKHG
jgi:hypothetical protein